MRQLLSLLVAPADATSTPATVGKRALRIALGVVLVSGCTVRASERRGLLSADDGHIVAANAWSSDHASRKRHVEVNLSALIDERRDPESVATMLELELFTDVSVVAVLDRLEVLAPRTIVWLGRLTTPEPSRVTLVLRDGVLSGEIVSALGNFSISADAAGATVSQSDPVQQAPAIPFGVAAGRTLLQPFEGRRALESSIDWLGAVNLQRAVAGLPPVTENPVLSAGDALHARYVVKNDVLVHPEDQGNPWYTAAGDAAGRTSNVFGWNDSSAPDSTAIEAWMQAPFHALGILDPRLRQVGYGAYREALRQSVAFGAALDVIHGLSGSATATFPIVWPGNGSTIAPQTPTLCPQGTACHWGESPSPLTYCGYTAPAGLPLILQLAAGTVVPRVTSSGLTMDGVPIEHCFFDQTSYTNPDPAEMATVRSVLGSRSAVVIVPRAPLPVGHAYRASVTTNGATYTWSFAVGSTTLAPTPVTTPTPATTPAPTATPAPTPGAPFNLVASASGGSVTLTWSAPTTGPAPTTYILEAGSAPGLANLANFSTGTTATTFSTTGVSPGSYYLRVRAATAAGAGAASTDAILVVGVNGPCTGGPGVPSGLRILSISGATVSLAWNAAAGRPTSYIVQTGSAPGASNLANSDLASLATSLTADGVAAGTYYVRVLATNACGTGPASHEIIVVVAATGPGR